MYCYYAEETVERHILDLAARQGKSLYTKDNAAGTLNANPLTVNSDKKIIDSPTKRKDAQKGDFVFKLVIVDVCSFVLFVDRDVRTEDMLAIFFPHLFEDIEYLIPPDELGLETHGSQRTPEQDSSEPSRSHQAPLYENAVAGPSRLR